jgi:hypothetical protein
MSVSGVSSNLSAYQATPAQGNFKHVRHAMGDLAQAFQAGDLPGAQEAYSALQQLMERAPSDTLNPSQGNGVKNQISTDLAAIGTALESGDLQAAQDAFTTLRQDIQAARHARVPHLYGAQGTGDAVGSTTEPSTSEGINVSA